MMVLLTNAVILLQLLHAVAAVSESIQTLYPELKDYEQSPDPLEVNLGYAIYRGTYSSSTGLNSWLGLRFGEAPTGNLRWQPSIPPETKSNGTVIVADQYSQICPQTPEGFGEPTPFSPSSTQSEDCLFLNVWAPANASNLPVHLWIHGGGYGGGDNQCDMPFLITNSQSGFVGVCIQYRLGAFGFLSSDEVMRFGTANAGLYDQYLSLQWVQHYIKLFGGDPSQVTIAGESAGGGSVMLQSMAFGGTKGTTLFDKLIAASPYLPTQYGYADFMPSQMYYAFASAAGCFDGTPDLATTSVFSCLLSKDSLTLQNASYTISDTAKFGQWAFLPVTDGKFIQNRPSVQLPQNKVNGQKLLVGNNANEGEMFTPQNVTTEQDFIDFVQFLFPLFTQSDIEKVLQYYPSTSSPVDPNAVRFATDGTGFPTAVDMSSWATGQQQRANNLYAETTFVCPAYWMAEAFSGHGRSSYKYEYSPIWSLHGDDLAAYFNYYSSLPSTMSQALQDAFLAVYTNFVLHGSPSTSFNSSIPHDAAEVLRSWPPYSASAPIQINLNQTGGVLDTDGHDPRDPFNITVTQYVSPGLAPSFKLVNAYTWEGGRGQRCDFWRNVGADVPE